MSASQDLYLSPTIDLVLNVPIAKTKYVRASFENPPECSTLIQQLGLIEHREGGYFKETDRSPFFMENPYYTNNEGPVAVSAKKDTSDATRNMSTLIYYLITPKIPVGRFHRNKSRIIHVLQRGSGIYVLIYPNGEIKSFRVGFDFAKGEIAQWVVPGGVWKASFLPDDSTHLLISEVVVPGFEYTDHTFLEEDELRKLVGERADEMLWLLGK